MNSSSRTGLMLPLRWLGICLAAWCHLNAVAANVAHQPVTKADVDRWMIDLSNWGRWGKEDQLGTLNLLTPALRLAAARLVREGVSYSLAHDALTSRAPDNIAPFGHQMLRTGLKDPDGASDQFSVNYHGYTITHMDALCHAFYHGRMYNGYPKELVTELGAAKLGIEQVRDGLFGRAVLVDIPRLKGVDYLEPGEAIYVPDLEAWEKKSGVTVKAGDILLIRTGRWARRAAKGPWDMAKIAGLHVSCARWMKQRDIAILGSDAASDVVPSGVEGVAMPVHQIAIIAMGTWILDNLDLEAVSAAAQARKRWEFLLHVAPLPVVGGTGSPINPVATF